MFVILQCKLSELNCLLLLFFSFFVVFSSLFFCLFDREASLKAFQCFRPTAVMLQWDRSHGQNYILFLFYFVFVFYFFSFGFILKCGASFWTWTPHTRNNVVWSSMRFVFIDTRWLSSLVSLCVFRYFEFVGAKHKWHIKPAHVMLLHLYFFFHSFFFSFNKTTQEKTKKKLLRLKCLQWSFHTQFQFFFFFFLSLSLSLSLFLFYYPDFLVVPTGIVFHDFSEAIHTQTHREWKDHITFTNDTLLNV